MEIIDNKRYIPYKMLIKSDDNPTGILSESMYKWLLHTKKQLRRYGRGCYGSEVMIEFMSLPPEYRRKWEELHPQSNSKSFIERIKHDNAARDYFETYCFGDDPSQKIKRHRIEQYYTDVMILNAIRSEVEDMTKARAKSGARPTGYWQAVLERIDKVREFYPQNGIPRNARALQRKYELYTKEGYESLVHKGNDNQNSAAIKDEESRAFLCNMLAHGTQYSDERVAELYNVWAKSSGKKEITARTVVNFHHKYDYEISYYRTGKRGWADKYDKVMHRDRPSAPLLLINSDDNDLDLYFKAEYTKKQGGKLVNVKTDYYRFKLYIILDAHCDYPIGYAYGHQITKEVIREAYRNAMSHIKEVTGNYYLWHQIVADRWGLDKEFRSYFERQAIFTPPERDNARSKVIERSFGSQWHDILREYNNYAGHNITADQKLSKDWIEEHRADYPTYQEGEVMIKNFIERLRDLSWLKSGKSRRQVWVENIKAMESSRERLITRDTYLALFGECRDRQITLTNRGVDITIDSQRHIYDIPDSIYRDVVGKKAQVIYDPADMSTVLVTDGDKMRFLASHYVRNKMALYDQTPEDRALIRERLQGKKELRGRVSTKKDERDSITFRRGIDTESYLKAGYLTKEQSFAATALHGSSSYNDEDDDDDNFLTTFLSKSKNKQLTQ